eukprot:SAG11_NODE_31274_length_293_cov_0.798969_1_plen_80_part_01
MRWSCLDLNETFAATGATRHRRANRQVWTAVAVAAQRNLVVRPDQDDDGVWHPLGVVPGRPGLKACGRCSTIAEPKTRET